MSTLTTAQLLSLTRAGRDTTLPAGFVAVPADRLTLPRDAESVRIDYKAFFSPTTNELLITGIPRATPRLDLVTQEEIEDTNIFSDTWRITTGPQQGGFREPSIPVVQTRALVKRLTDIRTGDYPNATVSFAAEGAVGLAFSAASYELRSGLNPQISIGSTVTLNAWTGHWTPDGGTDAGVLDIRTPHPANGDLAWGLKWRPGGVVATVNTGNAQLAGGLTHIGTRVAMAMAETLAGKLGSKVFGEGAAWMADKLIGQGAEAITKPAADAAAGAVANHIDSPARAIKALGWRANLTPAETIQVVQQDIGQGQWNVMHGLSPAGYAVDGTYYENNGTATIVGTGSTAETRQPAVQVTTWRDEATGAIMEARVSGQWVDDQFQAGSTGVFASGMDSAGRMILKGSAAQSVADYQMRPVASTSDDAATSEDRGLAPVVVETGSGLGTYTSVSIQTHANGAASFDFVGEDGSHAWVMHDVQTGHRSVVINSGREVAGEPRTVAYELDQDGKRTGQERYFDAVGTPVDKHGEMQAPHAAPAPAPESARAPAQQDSIPRLITHEQRIAPTPGGMSFAEAHKRRDEAEQISAGSLQPVGKLDTSREAKGSLLYRAHQAQEQDLMRGLGIAEAQDAERFRNEPAPQQPSMERTQVRAPRRLPDETPVQTPASVREEHAAATVVGTSAPGHADPAPPTPRVPAPLQPAAMVTPLQQAVAAEANSDIERATASAPVMPPSSPPPSPPMAQPVAAASAGKNAELAAVQARLAEVQEQLAVLTAQHGQGSAEQRNGSNERAAMQTSPLSQASEFQARQMEPAARARPVDPRDPNHPDHRDFEKIHATVMKDGRWDAQQSASISAQALAGFKTDPAGKRVDVVAIEADTFGRLTVFAGHAPWGEAKGCLGMAMVDPVQAARVPLEHGFDRLNQIGLQRELEAQRQQHQAQGGLALGR